jgi:hypothetical protein
MPSNVVPACQSASTQPVMPGTDAQFVHCQIRHPFPFQFAAGAVGVATSQCASHSTV